MARTRGQKVSRKMAVISAATGVLMAAGIAFAAWTATGGGSGYAKATSAQPLTTVDVSATTGATLYPGATGDVELEIDNPNPYPVRVTDVSQDGSITVDVGHAACDVGSITFTDQTGLTLDVGAETSEPFTLSGSIEMGATATDDCQGATFTVPVALSGVSNA